MAYVTTASSLEALYDELRQDKDIQLEWINGELIIRSAPAIEKLYESLDEDIKAEWLSRF